MNYLSPWKVILRFFIRRRGSLMELRPLNEVWSKVAVYEQSHFEQFKNFRAWKLMYLISLLRQGQINISI